MNTLWQLMYNSLSVVDLITFKLMECLTAYRLIRHPLIVIDVRDWLLITRNPFIVLSNSFQFLSNSSHFFPRIFLIFKSTLFLWVFQPVSELTAHPKVHYICLMMMVIDYYQCKLVGNSPNFCKFDDYFSEINL